MDSSNSWNFSLTPIDNAIQRSSPYKKVGKIYASRGAIYEVNLAQAAIGSNVEFVTERGESCSGEVVRIEGGRCLAMPYHELVGINSETRVYLKGLTTTIKIGHNLLGRVVNFNVSPIDGKGDLGFEYNEEDEEERSIFSTPINPLERPEIKKALNTGVHAINCFMTTGRGQRIAIMAGSGVGKSVTLGMIAQNTNADVNVIALIGERGREVFEFVENDLGQEGLKRSVVVVATSDESPLIRIKAAYVATTIAEYFRDRGKDVLLLMDSITRFAMANREVSLISGEPPGPKGYSPSVFAKMSRLLERAGMVASGNSITGFYTVLVEGGDFDEPISDGVRAISDGHIILERTLAEAGHFPAIDILASISRLMNKVVSKEHRIVAGYLRGLLAAYRENEDIINAGAYAKGSNARVDKALLIYRELMELMRQEQEMHQSLSIKELYDRMVELSRKAELGSEAT